MYFIVNKKYNTENRITYGVSDTTDGVTEYYTPEQIFKMISDYNLQIVGVFNQRITPVTFTFTNKFMNGVLATKELELLSHITAVSNPDGFIIHEFMLSEKSICKFTIKTGKLIVSTGDIFVQGVNKTFNYTVNTEYNISELTNDKVKVISDNIRSQYRNIGYGVLIDYIFE